MNHDIGPTIDDVAARAQEKVADLGHRAAGAGKKAAAAIDAQRGAVASGLDSAAAGLHAGADKLASVSPFAHEAADTLGATADYVRRNRMKDMASDVGRYVKANPTQAIVGALVVGFFAGRLLRRS